jgi:F-type H+-transporting ATPase subunit epsilon
MGTGVLYFNHGGTTTFMSVSGGVADVKDNVVTLLVDVAEDAPSIDVSRAEKALQRAQLARSGRNVEADIATAGHDEARALARIEAATLHSGARKV